MYVYLSEEELELLIYLVKNDIIEYHGITPPYEMDILEQHIILINKLINAKKVGYGE